MNAPTTLGLEALQPTHHGHWEPRRAMTLTDARKRTSFVRSLRYVLIAASGSLILMLFYQLASGSSGRTPISSEPVSTDVRMINPSFAGRDENLTPYNITADVAIRRRDSNAGLTELENPKLNYNFQDTGADMSNVNAELGIYDPTNRILDLMTNVHMNTDTGYNFETNQARVHLSDERVVGDMEISGSGPHGAIRADSYEIRNGGEIVIFNGNVRGLVVQDRTNQNAVLSSGENE
jgi:lipopolysaccharide export system protein LptC